MLLLYRWHLLLSSQLRLYLHSTMLLLYPQCFRYVLTYKPIYIPLCFYFIRISPGACSNTRSHLHSTMLLLYRSALRYIKFPVFNLHSTMLLLYLRLFPEKQKRTLIYIPLCFYFITAVSLLPERSGRIYIPLCFYFIQCDMHPDHRWHSFTFHYASTLSYSRYTVSYLY